MLSGQSTPDSGCDSQVQIIGMSATLPNVDQVAKWLDAVLFQTDFRPIELKQMVKIDNDVRDKSGQVGTGALSSTFTLLLQQDQMVQARSGCHTGEPYLPVVCGIALSCLKAQDPASSCTHSKQLLPAMDRRR